MKIINCTGSEDFKQVVKENMEQNIEPILYEKGFVKFKKFGYVRELNQLCQFITWGFNGTGGWRFDGHICYSPIFSPHMHLFSFILVFSDSSAWRRVDSKYYDFTLTKNNLPNEISNLIHCLNDHIFPPFDDMNSFEKYANEFKKDLKDIRLYREAIPWNFGYGGDYNEQVELIQIFNNLLNGDFEKGKKDLEKFKQYLIERKNEYFYILSDKNIVIKFIEYVLTPNENEKEITKESFLENIDKLSMENRIKYKLVKKPRKRKTEDN